VFALCARAGSESLGRSVARSLQSGELVFFSMALVLSSPFSLTPRFNVPQQLNFQSVVTACCPATSGGAGAAAIDAPFPSFQLAEQHVSEEKISVPFSL
jgi:hypothetical protein